MIGAAATQETLGEREYRAIRDRIYARASIWFPPAKMALIASRLQRRLRALNMSTYAEYLRLALADFAEETRMLECLCTHETSFFREPQHFELLQRHVLPRWKIDGENGARQRKVRALSAGCSSGEEPFSIAMMLADALPGWTTEVVAGDVSPRILEKAARAEWPIDRALQIPDSLRRRFMMRGVGENAGVMRATADLRALVRFQEFNLGAAAHAGVGKFDLIFCRNVLIYFDPQSKERAVRGLLSHLAPGGLFFVGHAESLSGFGASLETLIPTVYRSKPS